MAEAVKPVGIKNAFNGDHVRMAKPAYRPYGSVNLKNTEPITNSTGEFLWRITSRVRKAVDLPKL